MYMYVACDRAKHASSLCNVANSMHIRHRIMIDLHMLSPALQVKTGLLRSEDQKNVSRSLREHLDSTRQKMRLPKEDDREKSQAQATSSTTTNLLQATLQPAVTEGGQHVQVCVRVLFRLYSTSVCSTQSRNLHSTC